VTRLRISSHPAVINHLERFTSMPDAFAILTVLAYYGKADDWEGLLSDIRITLDRGQTINQWAEDLLSAHEEESKSD
jgi:hypothetical protein